jgi:hypothetical protein
MGSTLAKIASNCDLAMLRGSLGAAVGPSQFSVETKGGCDLIQWAMRMAMEFNISMAIACIDGINAFGEIERDCIRTALEVKPSLHMLIPMFECYTSAATVNYCTTTNMVITSSPITTSVAFVKAVY